MGMATRLLFEPHHGGDGRQDAGALTSVRRCTSQRSAHLTGRAQVYWRWFKDAGLLRAKRVTAKLARSVNPASARTMLAGLRHGMGRRWRVGGSLTQRPWLAQLLSSRHTAPESQRRHGVPQDCDLRPLLVNVGSAPSYHDVPVERAYSQSSGRHRRTSRPSPSAGLPRWFTLLHASRLLHTPDCIRIARGKLQAASRETTWPLHCRTTRLMRRRPVQRSSSPQPRSTNAANRNITHDTAKAGTLRSPPSAPSLGHQAVAQRDSRDAPAETRGRRTDTGGGGVQARAC